MSMKTVRQIMKSAGWGVLATTDGRRVGARPMGGWAWVGKELWSASGRSSDKVRQLAKVPYAEYCFVDKRGRHVRLAGRCTVSTRLADKKKAFTFIPAIKHYVASPANPAWVVLRLKPDRVRLMTSTSMKYEEVKAR